MRFTNKKRNLVGRRHVMVLGPFEPRVCQTGWTKTLAAVDTGERAPQTDTGTGSWLRNRTGTAEWVMYFFNQYYTHRNFTASSIYFKMFRRTDLFKFHWNLLKLLCCFKPVPVNNLYFFFLSSYADLCCKIALCLI